MKYKDITIVITTFKSQTVIFDCLDSINSGAKIIVVDNSNDSDLKIKLEKKYLNLSYYLSKENLGYGKANNLGLMKVKTKYALILNPDARLEKTTLDNFFVTANKNSDFAIISPFIQETKNFTMPENKSLIEVSNVKGFAMFLNMKEFSEVGFFDENFFIYFEEIDLCRRLNKVNKKIFLDPTIKIFHEGASSHDKEINYEMELSRNWHWMWSTFYYHKKYDGYIIALFKVFPKLFSAFLKVILYSITLNKDKKMIYLHRLLGLLNSIMLKKSLYRPKIL